jgi:hypothetical protein
VAVSLSATLSLVVDSVHFYLIFSLRPKTDSTMEEVGAWAQRHLRQSDTRASGRGITRIDKPALKGRGQVVRDGIPGDIVQCVFRRYFAGRDTDDCREFGLAIDCVNSLPFAHSPCTGPFNVGVAGHRAFRHRPAKPDH